MSVFGQSWACRVVYGMGLALVWLAAAHAAPSAGWPEFRGPSGNGIAETAGLPLTWSETENVTWKTDLPLQGWSTPVVLDGKIWLTWATPEGHDFHAVGLDAETGKILYDKALFHCDAPDPLGNEVNGYASPSPAIELGRVYIHFGSYGTACLDTATGNTLWERRDLPCKHFRGPGSSVALFENLAILTFDGSDVQYLAALDKKTGKTVWKTDRTTVWKDLDEQGLPKREGDFRKAFTTPSFFDLNGSPQMVSLGSYAAFAYDPRTGREIWRAGHDAYSPSSRPVFGNGLIYLVIGRGKSAMWAMRPEGQGDIGETQVVWKAEGDCVPQEPSALLVDGLLYLLSNNGTMTCFEADKGTQVWSEKLGGQYMASPIFAAGRIYVGSIQGKTSVLKAGRTFELLAENRLDVGFMASPAVVGKSLFLRTKAALYRIEEKNSPSK